MPGIYPALLLYNDENLTMCVYSGMDTTQASEACTMGSNPIRCTKKILSAAISKNQEMQARLYFLIFLLIKLGKLD